MKNLYFTLKLQVKSCDSKRRLCTVLFDEMSLETALTYSNYKDDIVGFADLNGKTNSFTDHVLVFMLRGAVCKWQQPVAFYFCEGATSSLQLKVIIKHIIAATTETGLKPIALVSDQGTSFQSAINNLLEETKRNQVLAGDNFGKLYYIFLFFCRIFNANEVGKIINKTNCFT